LWYDAQVQAGMAIDSWAVMAMEQTDTEVVEEEYDDVDLLVIRQMGETEVLAVMDVRLELVAMTCLP